MQKVAVLVDDDKDDLDLLSDCIRQVDERITCICFADAEEAMTYFASGASAAPTYIFLDVNMPKVRGDELLMELRKRRQFNVTIVAIYSTSMPSETSAEFIRQGADFALAKPSEYRKYFEDLQKILTAERLTVRT